MDIHTQKQTKFLNPSAKIVLSVHDLNIVGLKDTQYWIWTAVKDQLRPRQGFSADGKPRQDAYIPFEEAYRRRLGRPTTGCRGAGTRQDFYGGRGRTWPCRLVLAVDFKFAMRSN